MDYGVPQVFLQATLMRKEIFASLIGHAAELESQGRSFVDQQVSVSKKLVDMWKSEGTAYAAEVNDGRYLESAGKSGPPSWANDEQMQRDFATGVQILSGPDGLSRSEEHTSELQSLMRISYAVFCLKNKTIKDR